jgi:hypothetical protein
MLFLFFTEVVLTLIIIYTALKFDRYNLDMEQMYIDNDNIWLYWIPKNLPDWLYERYVIMGIKIGVLVVCGIFVLPLLLLILVQLKNFYSAKTTNERFSRRKTKVPNENSRGDSSSSDSMNGKLLNDDDDQEAKNRKNPKKELKSNCFSNCWEMCCKNSMDNQDEIYKGYFETQD